MPAFTIAIPETPSPNYVLVKNISLESSEKTGKEEDKKLGRKQSSMRYLHE
jgi:hypothetical protein